MQQWYPGDKASRLKKGNEGADHMCELGYLLDEPLSAPPVTQYHNHMLLQNIAPKTSCDSPFITERFRPTIKRLLRDKYIKKMIKEKPDKYTWANSPAVSKHTWNIMKSKKHTDDVYIKHFVRLLHGTLPTKSKIWKHKTKERKSKGFYEKETHFWNDKYRHVRDNKCTLCGMVEETTDHLHQCCHTEVKNI